jgi:hypothetical protein
MSHTKIKISLDCPFKSGRDDKTSSFNYASTRGFDTWLDLSVVNSSYMKKYLAIKEMVYKFKQPSIRLG